MKTFKALGILLVITAFSMSLTSCEEDVYESRLRELIIKDMTFSSSSASESQTFRNEDLSNYAVTSSDPTWCNATIDKENSKLTVSVGNNETYDQRQATITITDTKDATMSRTFTVTQAQLDALILDQTSFNVETPGGQLTIGVKSNVKYTVAVAEDSKDWVHIGTADGKTRALEESSIILTVDKNNSGQTRKGTVKVTNSKTNEVTDITIQQAFVILFSFEPATLSIDELGGEVSVKVTSNIGIDIYPSASWISIGMQEIEDDDTFVQKFRVAPFTEKKRSRTTTIVFENAAYSLYDKYVTVTQTRSLFIAESTISITIGERLALELVNSTDGDVTWTSSNEKVATVTKDGTVVGVADGQTTITVTSADGKHTDTATVQVVTATEAKLSASWSVVLDDNQLVSSATIKLKNDDSREILKGEGILYRTTVDGETQSTEIVAEDKSSEYIASGGELQFIFSGIAPKEPSSTAKYSYYMVWTYTVDNKEFTFRTYLN